MAPRIPSSPMASEVSENHADFRMPDFASGYIWVIPFFGLLGEGKTNQVLVCQVHSKPVEITETTCWVDRDRQCSIPVPRSQFTLIGFPFFSNLGTFALHMTLYHVISYHHIPCWPCHMMSIQFTIISCRISVLIISYHAALFMRAHFIIWFLLRRQQMNPQWLRQQCQLKFPQAKQVLPDARTMVMLELQRCVGNCSGLFLLVPPSAQNK
jgi:hypothetical protein